MTNPGTASRGGTSGARGRITLVAKLYKYVRRFLSLVIYVHPVRGFFRFLRLVLPFNQNMRKDWGKIMLVRDPAGFTRLLARC